VYPCEILYLGKLLPDGGSHGKHRQSYFLRSHHSGEFLHLIQPVNIFVMKIVKALFIKDEEQDDDTGSHTRGKTDDIDGGINLVFPKVAPGNLEIILKHVDVVLGGS